MVNPLVVKWLIFWVLTRKKSEQQIASYEAGQMKREIKLVRQVKRVPFGFFEVGQIFEHYDALTKKRKRIEQQAGGASDPGEKADAHVERSQHVIWVFDQLQQSVGQQQIEEDQLRLDARLSVDHDEKDEVPKDQMQRQKESAFPRTIHHTEDDLLELSQVEQFDHNAQCSVRSIR